jgi:ArsR family transcriptional regulator, arsenate/arsenite/antimonite-responsive transcriptional repressor
MKQTSTDPLAVSTELLKAFSDPVRLRLVNLLSNGREVCVCHLFEALELPQPTVSRHLAYLRKRGVVVGRKEGLWVHYRLAKTSSELQRRLIECAALADPELMRRDRERLGTCSSC